MLKKKKNPKILRVIKKLELLFSGVSFKNGNSFRIILNRSTLHYDYVSVCISSGLNGWGKWSDYLLSMQEFMKLVEDTWQDSFISDLNYDSCDDIFYFNVMIRVK